MGLKGAAALAAMALAPNLTEAQPAVERLWGECAEGQSSQLAALCADGALALQALHGGVGLLMTAGGALPASPSTAGHRMPGSPRFIFDVGGSWSTFRHPDLSTTGLGPGPPDTRSVLLGARLTTAAGIFDGFSLRPGVAGLLAVDAVGQVTWVRVPDSSASDASSIGWGGGIRVGLFRESFTLPGVTISGAFQRASELRFGIEEGAGALTALEPSVTSVRVIVGKDLWPIGLTAGMGWDRYRGEGWITARRAEGPSGSSLVEANSGRRELSMNRQYFFGGANFTWVVTQIAAELSWARAGHPIVALEGSGPFRPGGLELQGAVTVRLIY